MSESPVASEHLRTAAAFGADLSRWPEGRRAAARAALLRDPLFRRGWEEERALDRAVAAARGEIDVEIARAGAATRVRDATLARLAPAPLGRTGLARIAAAVLIAAVLGGATDLIVAGPLAEAEEIATVDPVLYGLDPAELQ